MSVGDRIKRAPQLSRHDPERVGQLPLALMKKVQISVLAQ